MKRLAWMAFFLVFSGCVHPAALRKLQSGNWAEFDKGNRLQGIAWSGSGCEARQDLLHIGAVVGEEEVCLSQSVAVLPGHYDFTVQFKIHSAALDLAHRLDDLVSIRLHVYDRWDHELDSHQLFLNQLIDAGQLNYGLNRVDSTQGLEEYSLLHLAPRYHPFDSLWLPEKAATVRVEVRLHGPAILHLKNFHFAYDKWNFPLRQRVEKLAAKEATLVPTPQEVKTLGTPWSLDSGKNALCIAGEHFHPAVERGLGELEQKLSRLGLEIPLPRGSCKAAALVVVLEEKKNLAHGSEAYAIQPDSSTKRNTVHVIGASPRAQFYALQTLAQLFDKTLSGEISFRPLAILDYPSFGLRSTTSYDRRHRQYWQEVRAGSWLAETRMNAILLGVAGFEGRWWLADPVFLEATQRLGKESKEYGLFDFGILFNPYQGRMNPKSPKVLRFSDDKTFREMEKSLKPFLQQGVRHLFLATDDLPPPKPGARFSYILEDPQDQRQFKTLSQAHAWMIELLDKFLRQHFPQTQLYFVPPWYNNLFVDLSQEKQGEPYLKELNQKISKDIPILWTGPTVRSLWIDTVQLKRYARFLGGRKPMLWDNTLYARRLEDFWGASAERADLGSFFEPYDVQLPADFAQQNHAAGVFLNGELTEFYRIQLATAGAYFWNPQGYQPETALWLYLKNRFGEKGARLLLDLDASLWQFTRQKNLYLSSEKSRKVLLVLQSLHVDALDLLTELDAEILSKGGADLLDELRSVVLRHESWLRQTPH